MKRATLFLGALLALALVNPIWAQGMQSQNMGMQGGTMMGQGMHGAMGNHGMYGMMGQMDGSGCGMMSMGYMPGFFLNQAETLGLNDSQVQQLEKIRTESQKTLIKKQADLRIAGLELNDLMSDAKAKRADLETKAKKLEELRSDFALAEFNAQLDARTVLTPEQLQKAQSLRMQFGHGQQGMMGMGAYGQGAGNSMMGSQNNNGMMQHQMHHPKSE